MILDPPRKGCLPETLSLLRETTPAQVIYVSCHPATMARDLNILCADGVFELARVQPLDMFPQTQHVECVADLRAGQNLAKPPRYGFNCINPMANEKRTDPRKNFVPRILPWLLAAAAFVFYWLTLNHWVSLFNLGVVAKTSGWDWEPEFFEPVFFLVTYPFHWLPVAQIPVALNIFSAVCAALTLGLLARSVAILPQDRTDAQRERERSDFSFLTIWSAWLPPVAGRRGLRSATDVLGTGDELLGRNVRAAAVRLHRLVAAGIPAG